MAATSVREWRPKAQSSASRWCRCVMRRGSSPTGAGSSDVFTSRQRDPPPPCRISAISPIPSTPASVRTLTIPAEVAAKVPRALRVPSARGTTTGMASIPVIRAPYTSYVRPSTTGSHGPA